MSPPRKPRKQKDQQPEGITRITVKGFKSLAEETSIEVRPLTILAGANSSGKSSIMQPLLLLKQTLDATSDPGPLKIGGPHVEFNSARQLFHKVPGRPAHTELRVAVEWGRRAALTDVFTYNETAGLQLAEMHFGTQGSPTIWRPEMTHEEVLGSVPAEIEQVREQLSRTAKKPLRWRTERTRCFLTLGLVPEAAANGAGVRWLVGPADYFEEQLRGVVHLTGLRGNPKRAYDTSAVAQGFPGPFLDYVASLVRHWEHADEERARLRALDEGLSRLGLTWKVRTRPVDDTHVELRVGRLPAPSRGGAQDLVSIADVGFGVSQVLPVVVALVAARPGQLLYIEQPEIHLHPRAQVELARLLVGAANRGVRVVAETHSSLLLLAVQTFVANKGIEAGKVVLHWFKRREEDGVTEVKPGKLSKRGSFGDCPVDFGQVSLEAQASYLEAIEAGSR